MQNVYMPAFYLGVQEELEKAARCWSGYEPVPGKKPYSEDSCRPKGSGKREKKANLQTSVPGETPEGLLARVRNGKANFPKFLENAQQHKWNIPGVPFSNSVVHGFLNSNKDNPEAIRSKILSQPTERLIDVIQKNPDAFRGVQNQQSPAAGPVQPISKVAFDVNSMPVNENILPSLSGQAKWKYARTKDGLKLSDGNLVYGFSGFPEEYPAEDTRISRGEDDNILNFDKDALSKGTAQIHRASPDNIYMTLANGADNPTFMLQHEEGKNWRYSPSKKFLEKLKKVKSALPKEHQHTESEATFNDSTLLDPSALLDGMRDQVKAAGVGAFTHPFGEIAGKYRPQDSAALPLVNSYHPRGMLDQEDLSNLIQRGVQGSKDMVENYISSTAESPISATLKSYAITKGIDSLRDYMNPEAAEERKKDPKARMRHEIMPIALAALPTLASMAIKAN